jgi:hypothetical protein
MDHERRQHGRDAEHSVRGDAENQPRASDEAVDEKHPKNQQSEEQLVQGAGDYPENKC